MLTALVRCAPSCACVYIFVFVCVCVYSNVVAQDCLAAVKWVKNNIWAFGGDTARLALVGESSGGTLAIATGLIVFWLFYLFFFAVYIYIYEVCIFF